MKQQEKTLKLSDGLVIMPSLILAIDERDFDRRKLLATDYFT